MAQSAKSPTDRKYGGSLQGSKPEQYGKQEPSHFGGMHVQSTH